MGKINGAKKEVDKVRKKIGDIDRVMEDEHRQGGDDHHRHDHEDE